jgi:uncharacterized membrane protein YphA (DoxX/SURF4 family)
MKWSRIVCWILQVVAALVLAQTLFFKFSGAPESVWIFSQLNAEPAGRYAAAIVELIAAVLLLIPRAAIAGAALGGMAMLGAIAAHLFRLGISVHGDGGLLLGLAVFVLFCCAGVIYLRRAGLRTS